jgi:hypothetical protein
MVRVPVIVTSLGIVYFGDLTLIWLCSPDEFQERMVVRWRRCLERREDPQLFDKADDLVDRAASIIVWWQWRRLLI